MTVAKLPLMPLVVCSTRVCVAARSLALAIALVRPLTLSTEAAPSVALSALINAAPLAAATFSVPSTVTAPVAATRAALPSSAMAPPETASVPVLNTPV
ncbi:hypothetical protein WG78_07460 [Amantichitinum ursilacus]|uniref:Uncharacterized protein n=1 Tax=Amantichitinum ursilacus TaxID=857265 RepID=A0A0N0GPB8_9NEIS|nr:hypothetical protein WG78_07460 [Amantichitinum ursilacus]